MTSKKKLSSSAKRSRTSGSWAEALEALTINDDHWWCMMTMIVESAPSQARIIELLDKVSENGSRKAIHLLTFEKLMSSVKSLSRIDEDKSPVAQGAFYHASRLIARGENLEAWLVARLVKYLVYRTKMETIERGQRDEDIEHEVDRGIRALLTVTNVQSQRSIKSARTKDSDRGFEVSLTSKPNTNSRKRGEDRKYKVYIDDAPQNGPYLFIILTGFRDPNFPLELIKAGLPLTCVLKIKSPRNIFPDSENPEENSANIEKIVKLEKKSTLKLIENDERTEFWKSFEKSLTDPKTLETYSNLIIRNFCPPEIPYSDDLENIEKYKKDLYDRVSYILYDLHDLQGLYTEYIRNMKVLHIPEEPPGESSIYRTIMNAVPAECSFVSIILQAMIAQVESNVPGDQPPDQSSSGRGEFAEFNKNPVPQAGQPENTRNVSRSLIIDDDPAVHEKKKSPDVSSGTLKKKFPSAPGLSPTMILQCDQLQLQTYHVALSDDVIKLVKPEPASLAELAERSFRDPRFIGMWRDRGGITEDVKKEHPYNINRLAQCLGFAMNTEKLMHLLNLRSFEKLIHRRLNRSASSREDGEAEITKNKEVFSLATGATSRDIETDQTLASDGDDPISNFLSSRSDSIIDYHVAQGAILGLPEMLGAPKNGHKMVEDLDPFTEDTGSEKLGETREDSSYLEKFIDVRLLSSRTLLQAVHRCFQEYPTFYSEYSEITDSMLLCFDHVDKPRESSSAKENEEKVLFYDAPYSLQTLRMVTPVGLKNFCEYVIHEEKDFFHQIEKLRSSERSMSTGQLTRKLSQHSNSSVFDLTTFTEDDFILPNSIKGQARRRNTESKTSKETDAPSKMIDGPSHVSVADAKTRHSSAKKHTKDKSLTSLTTSEIQGDVRIARKMPSLRYAREDEPYKFLGYDIGKFRVQLRTGSERFTSPDDTLVRVDLDEWVYGTSCLGIGIDLRGCFLKVQRTIGDRGNQNLPFNLTTNNGIVMAFSKVDKVEGTQFIYATYQ